MYTKDQIAELFYVEITEVCQAAGKTEAEHRSDSKKLVEEAVSQPSKEHLMAAKIRDGELVELTYYDPLRAIAFLASLFGAVIGAGSLIAVAFATVACLASLKGLRDTTSRAEGLLFLAVYESPGHMARRKEAEKRFKELCKLEDGVSPEDFSSAFLGLIRLDCIKQTDGYLSIKQRVMLP